MSLLVKNSEPAEREIGCVFAETFSDTASVFKNNGIITGNPFISNGATFDGANDYIKYSVSDNIFDSDELSIVIDFEPDFECDDTGTYYIFDTPTPRYIVYKDNAGRLVGYFGGTSCVYVSPPAYKQYWKANERNIFISTGKSGSNKMYLNGHLLDSSTTAWTKGSPSDLYLSSTWVGSAPYKGKINSVKIFQSILTADDAINYYENSNYNYEAYIDLPMTACNYDPSNKQTLDVSGNEYNAQVVSAEKLPSRGFEYVDTSSLRIPIVKTLTNTSISILVDVQLNGLSGYLFDFRRSSGAGYAYIDAVGNLGGYNVTFYVDGELATTIGGGIHTITVICVNYVASEGIDIGSRYNYNVSTNFLGGIKQFILHDYYLTPLQIADLHLKMLRNINKI